jgi:hypothetical protein
MRVLSRDLNRPTGAICLTGDSSKHSQQPVAGNSPDQIIRVAQGKVVSDVCAAVGSRARFGFGKTGSPGVFKFAHLHPPKIKRQRREM